jgi:hypothetical protein
MPLVAQGGVAGRFAMLAAPSSPRSLAVLELKSALYEALQLKLGLTSEPAPDALAKLAQRAGSLDESAYSALKEVLAVMQQIEASVVAGRPAPVSRAALVKVAFVVRSVLAACGADGASPGAAAQQHRQPTPDGSSGYAPTAAESTTGTGGLASEP